jgi:hypothetical protein
MARYSTKESGQAALPDASSLEDLSRIEDERKDVEGLKQDMEALQAMVVAQTAQLALEKQAVVRPVLFARPFPPPFSLPCPAFVFPLRSPLHGPMQSDSLQLQTEIQQLRDLLVKAEQRAEQATLEKQQAMANYDNAIQALQKEKHRRSKLQEELMEQVLCRTARSPQRLPVA